MFNVIEGCGSGICEEAAEERAVVNETVATTEEARTRAPYDWSNIAFAAAFCQQALAEHDQQLAC